MKYYSLNNKSHIVDFKTAVINGIAFDKGLYFPEKIPLLDINFLNSISHLSDKEIAFEVIKPFLGNFFSTKILQEIIDKTLTFCFPIKLINNFIYSLELFHGPTLAFKDVGSKFMANCLSYFNLDIKKKYIVLVATSGDTGGAVANGFLNIQGVNVVILYPSKKITRIQEKQLTTLGNNINAIEVNGCFDDCQEMVKTAFLDSELKFLNLTSANSINIARWLPQMFYYFIAYKKLKHKLKNKNLIFSIPSGNFGNICAGILAQKMGLPIKMFIASTNINDIIPNYLKTNIYKIKPVKTTISNAMDVANPSNFVRIQEIYNNNFLNLKNYLISYSYNDIETKKAMLELYNNFNYIADPHGAIGYLGLKEYLNQLQSPNYLGVFLETAHPIKFVNIVEEVLQNKLDVPRSIFKILNKKKVSIKIDTYQELKEYLISI